MLAFILRRLLAGTVVVLIVVMLVFLLLNAVGDPAAATLGPQAGPEQIADFKRKHGLDQPLPAQLGSYLGVARCVRGRRSAAVEDDVNVALEAAGRTVVRPHRNPDVEVPAGALELVGTIEPAGERRWTLTMSAINEELANTGETSGVITSGLIRDLGRQGGETLAGNLREGPIVLRRIERSDRCGLFQADLGESFAHNESVTAVIANRLPRTLLLGGMALFIQLIFGLGIGIVAALKRNTYTDAGLMSASYLGISLPTFVSGPLLLAVFGFYYGWFPLGGYGVGAWDHVWHATLPAFTLAVAGAATYARIMRSELVDTLRSDYVRTATAKGLGRVAVLRHAVRNALLPIVTMLGLSMTLLVAGAIITEKIFGWPGMGNLAIQAILNLDAPTVMGVVLVFAVTVQIGNLLADVAVALLDPRVRVEKTG